MCGAACICATSVLAAGVRSSIGRLSLEEVLDEQRELIELEQRLGEEVA